MAEKSKIEPVSWRREWDGDVSDLGLFVHSDDKDELDNCGIPWEALYSEIDVAALSERLAEAERVESQRWADRLNWIHAQYDVDGSGCESGDALDVIEIEIELALSKQSDRLAAAEEALRELARLEDLRERIKARPGIYEGQFADTDELHRCWPLALSAARAIVRGNERG